MELKDMQYNLLDAYLEENRITRYRVYRDTGYPKMSLSDMANVDKTRHHLDNWDVRAIRAIAKTLNKKSEEVLAELEALDFQMFMKKQIQWVHEKYLLQFVEMNKDSVYRFDSEGLMRNVANFLGDYFEEETFEDKKLIVWTGKKFTFNLETDDTCALTGKIYSVDVNDVYNYNFMNKEERDRLDDDI